MNLILSDVEETIMIVEQPDGVPEGQNTVNVSHQSRLSLVSPDSSMGAGSEAEDGHAVRTRRRGHLGASFGFSYVMCLLMLALKGFSAIADLTYHSIQQANILSGYCYRYTQYCCTAYHYKHELSVS